MRSKRRNHGGSRFLAILRGVGLVLLWLVILAGLLWAGAALFIDLQSSWRLAVVGLYAAAVLGILILAPNRLVRVLGCIGAFAVVLAWWTLLLQPSETRDWQKDVDRTAWAEINGNAVTIHNLRNFTYRTETDYTPVWEERHYDLDQLTAADIFLTFWGSPWIAHPIVSFAFADGSHVAISVEVRKVTGQGYSSVLGFFKQYALIYIVSDERDVIRLRTNYRTGEEVYLYRTTAPPEAARSIFVSYLETVNALHEHPAFYNALTSNCTTNIRVHTLPFAKSPSRWDWRLLLNGKSDEYAYQYGRLAGDLPFDALKAQAHINDTARAADAAADFSDRIRAGRAGFPAP
jgi:hypothetical protein